MLILLVIALGFCCFMAGVCFGMEIQPETRKESEEIVENWTPENWTPPPPAPPQRLDPGRDIRRW